MPVDSFVAAELLSTCSSLGYEIRGAYEKGGDCIECLKDLIRYLKRDDDDFSILRQLGHIKLLQTDLIPLLKRYGKEKQVLDLVLRLLVILTNPALLLFKEEVPEDKLTSNVYLEIITYLQNYKVAFTDASVWSVLNECLQKLLQEKYEDRDEDDRLTVERILIVVRNVLHIPPDQSSEKRTDDDVNIHDQILWALHMSGLEDLLLYLSGCDDESQYCLHVIEIISLILREQSPETLANAGYGRSLAEKKTDDKMLVSIRKKEEALKSKRHREICYSRFSGAYYVKNMKSISEREHITHKLITTSTAISFDKVKNGRKRPKNRLPVVDTDICRRSTLSICLFLKDFCIEVLNNSYNVLMSIVKKSLLRQRSEDHDESYYLWAMGYFMEFNRLSNFQLAVVSETISVQSFHYIQTQIDTYYEMLLSERKKTQVWSKRMHLALRSYKELLMTLSVMDNHAEDSVKQCANVIKGNIFYVLEYRELLLTLLMNFDVVKFSISYLKDLVETTHIFVKMLNNYTKKHSHLVVQKKVRKRSKKRKKETSITVESEHDFVSDKWDAVVSDLSAILQGRGKIPSDICPFDASSEKSIEEQKVEPLYKIQEALNAKEAGKAVALLRSAREVWPEGNTFGTCDIEPEEEFLILREIFMACLPNKDNTPVVEEEKVELDEDEEENEEMYSSKFSEQQFKLEEFLKRFASPKVVQPYCLLMANYSKNSSYTNFCIAKMLHRIVWDCKMHGLLFQASVFLTFQKILNDLNKCDFAIKELSRLAKFVVGKFFAVAKINKKVFMEILFWKGPREVYELEEGYGSFNNDSAKVTWTEEEEEELKYLYEKNKDVHVEGEDVIDAISKQMKTLTKSKRQIMYKIKNMGLIQSIRELHPKPVGARGEWQEAEIVELHQLFQEHKSSNDILGNILNFLTIKRSRQAVITKLLELHLINDRKELRKRASKKKKGALELRTKSDSESENSELDDYISNQKCVDDRESKSASDESEDERHLNEMIRKWKKPEWKKEEVMELHALYKKYKTDINMMHCIASDLSHEKPLHEVEEKLIELGLCSSKDNVLTTNISDSALSSYPVNTCVPSSHKNEAKWKVSRGKDWQESELMNLSSLFEEGRKSSNVMEILLNSLKRPRKVIIEKLLELGLITDRKQVRKKRMSNKKKDEEQFSEYKNSNLTMNDIHSSDDDRLVIIEDELTNKSDNNEDISPKNPSKSHKQFEPEISPFKEVMSDNDPWKIQIQDCDASHNYYINSKIYDKTKLPVNENENITKDLIIGGDYAININAASTSRVKRSNEIINSDLDNCNAVQCNKVGETNHILNLHGTNKYDETLTAATVQLKKKRCHFVDDSDDSDDGKIVLKDDAEVTVPDSLTSFIRPKKRKLQVLDDSD